MFVSFHFHTISIYAFFYHLIYFERIKRRLEPILKLQGFDVQLIEVSDGPELQGFKHNLLCRGLNPPGILIRTSFRHCKSTKQNVELNFLNKKLDQTKSILNTVS